MHEKPATGETICRSCGKTNLAGMRFCGFCGNPIGVPAKPPASAAPVPPTTVDRVPPPAPAVPVRPVSPSVTIRPPVTGPASAPRSLEQERERERLISQATAFRVKGQITDARLTLQKALEMTDGMSPQTLAPLYEQLGDLLLTEEMYDESLAALTYARELDPKRISADRKFAEASLQKAKANGKLSINEALLRGDSVADLIVSGELGGNRGKRNAGVAMLLSMLGPGFGQFYNGQLIKGFVLMGAFAISLLVLSLTPEKEALFHDIAALFAMQGGKASFAISPLTSFFALVCIGTWLYGLVDAPFNAGKSGEIDIVSPTKIDKSGWEV